MVGRPPNKRNDPEYKDFRMRSMPVEMFEEMRKEMFKIRNKYERDKL